MTNETEDKKSKTSKKPAGDAAARKPRAVRVAKADGAKGPAKSATSFSELKSVAQPRAERTASAPANVSPIRTSGTHIAMKREKKVNAQGAAQTRGARKNAIARVFLKPGSGKITVNGKTLEAYFARPVLRMMINQPLQIVARETQYDISCNVNGGGLSGQAGAVRHGIARALCDFEPDLRPALKKEGFLTRDARMVERKKYGRAGARRRFQFSKR